jgi:hypothetical protein
MPPAAGRPAGVATLGRTPSYILLASRAGCLLPWSFAAIVLRMSVRLSAWGRRGARAPSRVRLLPLPQPTPPGASSARQGPSPCRARAAQRKPVMRYNLISDSEGASSVQFGHPFLSSLHAMCRANCKLTEREGMSVGFGSSWPLLIWVFLLFSWLILCFLRKHTSASYCFQSCHFICCFIVWPVGMENWTVIN